MASWSFTADGNIGGQRVADGRFAEALERELIRRVVAYVREDAKRFQSDLRRSRDVPQRTGDLRRSLRVRVRATPGGGKNIATVEVTAGTRYAQFVSDALEDAVAHVWRQQALPRWRRDIPRRLI